MQYLSNCRSNNKKNNILSKKTKKKMYFFIKEGIFILQGCSVIDTKNKMNKASAAIVRKRDLC